MTWSLPGILCVVLAAAQAERSDFPPDFKFGVATSSYQIEGGWNLGDKGESIWDNFTHRARPYNGDDACNSYNLWEKDVENLVTLGVHYYRMSISWPRLLPSGFPNIISEDGLKYYNTLIDALIARGIEPMITIYHWDLPQRLQDLGGWTNPLVSDWFADYSRIVYSKFGDRVKTWLTINEPNVVCDLVYNTGRLAPGIQDPEVANYLCTKNLLIAHAKAYRVYDEEFRSLQGGRVSLPSHMQWYEPLSDGDEALTNLALQYGNGRFATPIFSPDGGWPPEMEQLIADNSRQQGYARSRLPEFTPEEIKLVRGTFDFFGLNFFSSRAVRPLADNETGLWPKEASVELGAKLVIREEWEVLANSNVMYPEGLRKLLRWLKESYGDMEFIITESGFNGDSRDLTDDNRINHMHMFLEQLLKSIYEDKVNVTGFIVWSLMDNFGFLEGYGPKFGLYDVDFEDANFTRTARKSAKYYNSIIKAHSLDVPTDFDF